jgi:hypothetical protein
MRRRAVTLRHKHRRTRLWRGIFALWLSVSLAVPQSAWALRPQLTNKAGLEDALREESSPAAGLEEDDKATRGVSDDETRASPVRPPRTSPQESRRIPETDPIQQEEEPQLREGRSRGDLLSTNEAMTLLSDARRRGEETVPVHEGPIPLNPSWATIKVSIPIEVVLRHLGTSIFGVEDSFGGGFQTPKDIPSPEIKAYFSRLKELILEIRAEIETEFKLETFRGRPPTGNQVANLSGTPLGQSLVKRVGNFGYEGDRLLAVQASTVMTPSARLPAAQQQLISSLYIPSDRGWSAQMIKQFREDGRYPLAKEASVAAAVVVDGWTPVTEILKLLAEGKILFEIRTLKDVEVFTPVLLDRLIEQKGLLTPGTLFVIQSLTLTAPDLQRKRFVLIFA